MSQNRITKRNVHSSTQKPDYEASMPNSSVNYTPESDCGKIDVNEAKRRLATIKQGTDTVIKYFDRCRHLVEIVNGGHVERNDSYLFAVFMNGLSEKTRKVIHLTGTTDAFTARKHAIHEEMFLTVMGLQSGNEEDRIHKIEVLNHCQWEKLRMLEGKLNYVQLDVHQMKKDVSEVKKDMSEVKDMLKVIMENTLKNSKNNEEEKTEEVILERVNELQETVNSKFENLEKMEKIERVTVLGYEWIRQVHNDFCKMGVKPQAPPTAPGPASAPTKTASPLIPVAPEKRVNSSSEEAAPPSKRIRRCEEQVLEKLHGFISEQDYQKMVNGKNVTVCVGELYQVYKGRADDIRRWMEQKSKPVGSACTLCGYKGHHGYQCPEITSVDERKRILKSKSCCLECSKLHRGVCTAKLECRICTRAIDDKKVIIGGIQHCRMLCPLQEEFHMAMDFCDKLLDAKHFLESV